MKKKRGAWLLLCLVLCAALGGCAQREPAGTVQVTVYGKDGALMLEQVTVTLYDRFSVFDALIKACGAAEIEIYARGSGIYAVVTEIGGLREADGAVWSFTVNGGEASANPGRVRPQDGGEIVFSYGIFE